MPLYAKDGQGFVDEGLRAAVLGAVLYRRQSVAQSSDGLVMSAVDGEAAAVEGVQPGAGVDDGDVVLVAVFIFVKLRGGHILNYGSAQPHIDELHALADAQNRLPVSEAQLQRLELQNIQLGVNAAGAVIFFPEEGGGDIAAPGEQQGVASGDVPGV